MGYPMDYERVLRRNMLTSSAIIIEPPAADFPGPERFLADVDYIGVLRREIERLRREEQSRCLWLRGLLSDLRRLEHDARDERAICQRIAQRRH